MILNALAALVFSCSADSSFSAGPAEIVAEGYEFTEGPVWLPEGKLIFSDIPKNGIFYGDKSVFRQPSGHTNGSTLDLEGRVICAEHEGRRVSRMEKDGTASTIADRFEGKRFNSPNDVIVARDGTFYFTDPDYGLEGGMKGPKGELGFCGVFAVSPKGEVRLLSKHFNRPNGLALSPDEKKLYVADSEDGKLYVFDRGDDGTVANQVLLHEVGTPDGLKVDTQGNLWITSEKGVVVVDAKGMLLETIAFPLQPANCAFGGADGKTLYVTARGTVYKMPVTVQGIFPGKGN